MPGIVIPVHQLKEEDRRNLLLRLRFGPHIQASKSQLDGSLCVEGQAVVHRPRNRNTVIYQPFSNDKSRSTLDKSIKVVSYALPDGCKQGTDVNAASSEIDDNIFEGPTAGKRSKNSGISPENSADSPAEDGIVFVGKIERKPGSSQGTARLSASDFEVEYRYDDSERGDGETVAKSNLMRSRRRLNNRKDGSTIEMSDNGETFARRISKGQNNVAEESEINVYSPRKMRGKETNTQWTDLENENEEQERKVISVDLSFHSNEAESPPPSSAARRVSLQPSQRGENVTMSYKPRDRNITSNPVREDSQPHARRSFSKPSLHRRRFSKNTDNHKRTQNKESKIEKSNFEFPSKDEMEDLETTTARKFYEMPNSKPKNVCFDFPGVDLTFLDVKRAIEAIIPDAFEANKVVSVQFENVNVKLGTRSRQNRWHIELADFVTRNKLIKSGLTIKQYRKPNIDIGCSHYPSIVRWHPGDAIDPWERFVRKSYDSDWLQCDLITITARPPLCNECRNNFLAVMQWFCSTLPHLSAFDSTMPKS